MTLVTLHQMHRMFFVLFLFFSLNNNFKFHCRVYRVVELLKSDFWSTSTQVEWGLMVTAVTVGDHFASATVIINLKYASIMLMGKVPFYSLLQYALFCADIYKHIVLIKLDIHVHIIYLHGTELLNSYIVSLIKRIKTNWNYRYYHIRDLWASQ